MNILIKELENLKKFKEYVSDINKKISPYLEKYSNTMLVPITYSPLYWSF